MRVVSLVPSWTETLLQAGVNVVGRTRFCIHPREKVAAIPVVGGTKDWDLARIRELKPDLILLDREENPKSMADEAEFPILATHVEGIQSVAGALMQMGSHLNNHPLQTLASRWEAVAEWEGLPSWQAGSDIPGLIAWGRKPEKSVNRVVYVIWRNPWMAVSKDTFIGSVLDKCGINSCLPDFVVKYPEIQIDSWEPSETLLLFSSEPFPFLRKKSELLALPNPHAFVDGESYSWFGVRSLEFLEGLKTR